MRCSAAILLLLLAPLTSCQCAQQEHWPRPGWLHLARFSGWDAFTEAHVVNLLEAHGIETTFVCRMCVCDLAVPADQHAMAVKLLQLELRDSNTLVILHTPYGRQRHTVAESAWQVCRPRLEHQELLKLPEAAATIPLGAALRDPSVVAALPQFPYVVCVETLPRTYLDRNRQRQTGHDFIISLAETPDAPAGARRGVQVSPNGESWERPAWSHNLPD